MASRVALLGNIAFAACVLLRYVTFTQDPVLSSLLLILGWFIGIWFNVVLTLVLLAWRRGRSSVPAWLMWVNAVFGAFQLYYFFFI
jgi:threonine/homoserine/homoserine lactone efflux protein